MKGLKIMREMRRKDKEIGTDEAISLLTKCEYGVLSTAGNDGQPYGVPLNYAYKDNCIYFHCALAGHKIDNIESNPKVSFCAVGDTKILPSEFSTEYVSAVAFGVASEVQGSERYNALVLLLEKFSPEFIEEGKKYIEKLDKVTKVIKIEIEHISGKKAPAKS
jgi:nitroimidazol reductase NimA-like FMN-containing flavoprotein (pyridoxamine 5'-phosphate oxidase superfamily)